VPGQPRSDHQWEHWPGRGAADDGIRHRLKALFGPTDGEEAVNALINERGREIEERTDQLREAIADLERREEQTARLRSAVEEVLHHGSTELDERHADLAALAVELSAREENIRAAELDLAARKQELGAVELRRAAVERREQAAAEREAKRGGREQPILDTTAHILHVAGNGYRIVSRTGTAPTVDTRLEIDGRPFVVTRVGRSPLPNDRRTCAYLEPTQP
jgi:hypothetical protein